MDTDHKSHGQQNCEESLGKLRGTYYSPMSHELSISNIHTQLQINKITVI